MREDRFDSHDARYGRLADVLCLDRSSKIQIIQLPHGIGDELEPGFARVYFECLFGTLGTRDFLGCTNVRNTPCVRRGMRFPDCEVLSGRSGEPNSIRRIRADGGCHRLDPGEVVVPIAGTSALGRTPCRVIVYKRQHRDPSTAPSHTFRLRAGRQSTEVNEAGTFVLLGQC